MTLGSATPMGAHGDFTLDGDFTFDYEENEESLFGLRRTLEFRVLDKVQRVVKSFKMRDGTAVRWCG